MTFILREHANSEEIPKAALLHYLQQEYEVSPQKGIQTWSHYPDGLVCAQQY